MLFKKILFLLCFFSLLPLSIRAEEIIIFNEQDLLNFIDKENPTIERINSLIIKANVDKYLNDENFAPKLGAFGSYETTHETLNSSTSPMTDPTKEYGVSYKQNMPFGVDLDISNKYVYSRKEYVNSIYLPQENKTIYNSYEPATSFSLTLDLWKNFLGYTNYAKIKSFELSQSQNEIKAKIEKNNFNLSIEKIYWNIVLNEESLKLYEEILNLSKILRKNVLEMYKVSAADESDVAQVNSIVALVESNLFNLKLQQTYLEDALREILPNLINTRLHFKKNSGDEKVKFIKKCVAKINKLRETPKKFSLYDDFTEIMNQKIKQDLKAIKKYSDLDIKMTAGADYRGENENKSKAFGEMKNGERIDYSVGLDVSLPLGRSFKNSKINQEKLLLMYFRADLRDTLNKLDVMHLRYQNSNNFLFEILKSNETYKNNLQIKVKNNFKKYSQGRIALSELIQTENDLLSAEINLLKAKKDVIFEFFNYLNVFNQFECD